MTNYQKIINSFKIGNVEGIDEYGMIPEHIETQISHVFLFSKTVYKICKRDNIFFNSHFRNIADFRTRVNFYEADFFENHYFSPDIYLKVFSVQVLKDKVILCDIDENNEDVVMEMKKVDLRFNLSTLLHKSILTEKDFRNMGYQQTKNVALYPHQPKTQENYYDILQRRLDDVRDWMYSAPKYFSKEKVDEVVKIMRDYVEANKVDFITYDKTKYTISLDNHSDNMFYENGKLFFLDIYPPKEDWMVVTPWTNIYRPATDILILMGEKYAEAFLQGYKDYYGSLNEKYKLFYYIYSATIQGVSLHNLSANNNVKLGDSIKYKDFILKNIELLKNE